MLLVVAPDGDHVAARLVEWRQKLEVCQRARFLAGRRQRCADAGQAIVTGVDHGAQVSELGDLNYLVALIVASLPQRAKPATTVNLEHQKSHILSSSSSGEAGVLVPAPRNSSSKS